MPDREKFLIVGASGLLGRHLHSLLGRERAIATYCSNAIEGGIHFDATSMRLRDTLLRGTHGIQAAFLLYGLTNLDECAGNTNVSSLVNVQSLKHAIDDLLAAGVKPIFTSSDAVFDGSRGMWTEADAVNPILTYGTQKLEVERYLQSKKGPWIIARLSKLVSGLPERRNLLNDWINQIERNEQIRCATDLVFSPADASDAARALVRLAEEPLSGLFNVAGSPAIRRVDLLNMLVAEIGLRASFKPKIVECRMRDLILAELRPLNVSLDPARLYAALGERFRAMESVCVELVKNRYGEHGRLANSGRTGPLEKAT